MLGQPSSIPGFEVALHRSLTEPILLAGAPRSFAILNGTLAAAIGLGLRLWIAGLLVWLAGHASPCGSRARTRPSSPSCPATPATRERSHAEPRRIPQEDDRPCRLPALGLPGRRPASSSTRTARSSARCATAAPTSTAPPRPSSSPSRARLNNVLKRFGDGLGAVLRGRARARQPVSRRALRRRRVVAGRPGALRRLQRRRRPPREPLLPDLPLSAAARARGPGRAPALRAHRRRRPSTPTPHAQLEWFVDRDRPRAASCSPPSCPRPRRSTTPRR